jgi:hypothetical protein
MIWLLALAAVALVTRKADAIGLALAITGASFLIALVLVVPARIRRDRRERRG